ncbi:MAG: 2,3-dihydro-2,3-dihydroxybenzoate dehydrogenase [Firmicutes bacterium]|nr:2,3-dihydro-2,3-dihydroxybenzoate dehydrogenase [Bacillota bacterium]
MAGANLSTLDAILKDQFAPMVEDQLQSDIPMLQFAKKKTTSLVGRRFLMPIHVSRNEGMGFRSEGAAMPQAGNQGYVDTFVYPAYFYGRYQLTAQAMEQSRSDVGAFIRGQQSEMQGMATDIGKRLNQALYLNKYGVRGTVGSLTGTGPWVLTLTGASKGLEIGMRVDVWNAGYTTKRNTGGAPKWLTITAVTDAGLKDTSVTTITVSGTAAGIAATDVITQEGWVADGTTSAALGTPLSITGLADAIGTGSYLTVDPATYPIWAAQILNNGGSPRSISEDLIQQAMDVTRQKGGQTPDALFTTYNQRRRFFNSLTPNRRFVNTKKLVTGGVEVVDFDGTEIFVDPDAPAGMWQGIKKDQWSTFQTRDGHWIDDDGHVLHRALDDTDAYFATWRWFFQLGCKRRNVNFRLGDMTE